MALDIPVGDGYHLRSLGSMTLMPAPPSYYSPLTGSVDFAEFHARSKLWDRPDIRMPIWGHDMPRKNPRPLENRPASSNDLESRPSRKRAKAEPNSDEKRERQAAKNRETAKAFRNKMDNLKAYSERRVSALRMWVRGLAELVIAHGTLQQQLPVNPVRRCLSAPM